jgi:hypothetical protein
MKLLIQKLLLIAAGFFVPAFGLMNETVIFGQCLDTSLIRGDVECPTSYDPVCGCDGMTYQNACEAESRYGVTTWTKGPCRVDPCTGCPVSLAINSRILLPGELCQISYRFTDTTRTYTMAFGDGEELVLEQAARTVPHSYAYPGYYQVAVRSNDGMISTKQHVLVLSCGWQGYTTDINDQRQATFAPCTFINNELMYLAPSEVGSELYWSRFSLTKPMDRQAAGTSLSARIKISRATGGISCYDPTLQIFGAEGQALIRFMQPGCSFYSQVIAGETIKSGSSDDLTNLVGDFSDWVELSFSLTEDTMLVYFNDLPIYQTAYSGPIGEVWGFGLSFKGSGQADWMEWKENATGEVLYREDFSSCEGPDPFTTEWTLDEMENKLQITGGGGSRVIKVLRNGETILFSSHDTIVASLDQVDSLQIISTDGCHNDSTLWVRSINLSDTICFHTDSLVIRYADTFEIPVFARGEGIVSGLQLGFETPDHRLKIHSVSSALPGWSVDNYVIDSQSVQIVWIGINGTYTIAPDLPVFTVQVSWDSPEDTCLVPIFAAEFNRVLSEYNGSIRDMEICFDISPICFDLLWDCEGRILHRDDTPFEGVTVTGDSLQDVTDARGFYQLPGLKKDTVHISATYDSDPGEGVDILDMVALYRHQLKLEEFVENYAWLAGDVDDNQALTLADLAVMQLMLLGKIDQWPSENTWKFIAKNQLPGEELLKSPPPMVAFRTIPNPVGVGIKTGDVVRERNRQARSGDVVTMLHYTVKQTDHQLNYSIDLTGIGDCRGLQLEILYDSRNLVWSPPEKDLDWIHEPVTGEIRIILLHKDDFPAKIELAFKQTGEITGVSPLRISGERYRSKVVSANGDVSLIGMSLIPTEDVPGILRVFPNPAQGSFNVQIRNQQIAPVRLAIYNHLGQLLYHKMIYPDKPDYTESIQLPTQVPGGVYHFTLTNEYLQKNGTLIYRP